MGRKFLIVVSILLVTGALMLFGGRYVIFYIIEKKIINSVEDLRAEGIQIKYDSLYTESWAGALTITGFRAIASDSTSRDTIASAAHAEVEIIKIEGIQVLPLLFRRKLEVDRIALTHPVITWAETFKFPKSRKPKKNKSIQNIQVDQLKIDSAAVTFLDSLYNETKMLRFHSLAISGINLETKSDSPQWTVGSSSLDSMTLHFVNDFYTLHVKKSEFNAIAKTLQIDSIQLQPDYDKTVFAKKSVRQTDRIQAVIPSIKAIGFAWRGGGNAAVKISELSLNFNIEIFRDKRYPFHNNRKTLPERFLHTIPMEIQVDTLLLHDSYLLYEEFPESGDHAGSVHFNKLHASLYNLSNISPDEATMDAEANFMDSGKLKVHFTFPVNPDKDYTAQGTLTNFSLPKVNSMLEPLTNAEIQSGNMEEMKFNFLYNDFRSDGHVILNYTNLKMATRKKSSLGSKIVTLLLNTFIRNTMDKSTAADKKTGTILFYRDNHRAIFNYWWKSLLSGIKSVYNLDKISNTSSNKKK